jgi:mono/diheme cytochrome c family protein
MCPPGEALQVFPPEPGQTHGLKIIPMRHLPTRPWNCATRFLLAIFVFLSSAPALLAEETKSPGEQLYQAKCVACHGGQGEGTAKHKRRHRRNHARR